MTMSKDQQQAEIMNNGREKREVRERKEREIKKRAVWEYKMIFFFFYNLTTVSLYQKILAYCSSMPKILPFEIFDGVAFCVF